MTGALRIALVGLLCVSAVLVPARSGVAAEFPDVPKWHWAWCYVQGVCDAEVAGGYVDGYHPEWVVSRDQMAVFIARAMCGGEAEVPDPECTEAPFPDVACDFWACKHVVYCVDEAVVSGYEDGYHPDGVVSRDQMAVFLARAMCGGEDQVPDPPCEEPPFPDVSCDFWARKHIQYILGEGVTQGYPDGLYHPEYACSRDQMAVFMCRGFELPMPPQPYNVTDYFPLGEGDTWTYKSEDGAFTQSASGTEVIGGQLYTRLVFDGSGIMYWRTAADGLRLGGEYDPEDGMLTYDPAFYIANGLDPGDEGTHDFTVYVDGVAQGQGVWSYQFVGVEGVTVPAGIFPDCMKLEIHVQVPGGDDMQFYMWAAKSVGEVKQDSRPFGSDYWEELVSATVGGVQYPAEGWDVTDHYPLAEGDTRTYDTSYGEDTRTVSGTEMLWGQEYACLVASDGHTVYWQSAPDGVQMGGWYEPGEDTCTFNPGLYFPNDLYPGDGDTQVSTFYQGSVSPGTVVCTYQFVGLEDVTVPAGTFPDCMKIEVQLECQFAGGEDLHTYFWWANGVGQIKEDERPFGGEYWEELASATVGGVSYP